MYPHDHRQEPSILNLLIVAVLSIVILAYAGMSFSTNDLLWFWPIFNEEPESISVYCYGEEVFVDPGSEAFIFIRDTFNEILSGYKNWDSTTMSDSSWADYQVNDQFATLIFRYEEPVRIHSTYLYFSGVDTLVIPLDGRHAATRSIFGLRENVPGSGSFHVESFDEVSEFLIAENICPIILD